MNLKQLHEWFGKLLEAGVDPKLAVTCLVDGWPCEVSDAAFATGGFKGDPSPQMVAFSQSSGHTLVLVPIGQDQAELFSQSETGLPPSHLECELPVEFPSYDSTN